MKNRGEVNLISVIDMAFIDWSLRQLGPGGSREQDADTCHRLGKTLLEASPALLSTVDGRDLGVLTARWASTVFFHFPDAASAAGLLHCARLAAELAQVELCSNLVWSVLRCGGVTEEATNLVLNADASRIADLEKLSILSGVLGGELKVPDAVQKSIALRIVGGHVGFASKTAARQARALSTQVLK